MATISYDNRRVGSKGHTATGDDLEAALMAELNKVQISQRLQKARRDAGLTQQQMADLLHVHKRSVEDYESPRNATVPWDRVAEWAAVTGSTPEWLLHGESAPALSAASDEAIAELRGELSDVRLQLARIEQLLQQLADSPDP